MQISAALLICMFPWQNGNPMWILFVWRKYILKSLYEYRNPWQKRIWTINKLLAHSTVHQVETKMRVDTLFMCACPHIYKWVVQHFNHDYWKPLNPQYYREALLSYDVKLAQSKPRTHIKAVSPINCAIYSPVFTQHTAC